MKVLISYIQIQNIIFLGYGTGSYPLPPHGLHLNIRHIAKAIPLIGPCLISACLAYSEQVGVNLQDGGV